MNQPVTITQPDGTELSVLASGDEFHNWLHDENNYTIIQDKQSGWYAWAVRNGNQLVASTHLVGQSNPSALGLSRGANLPAEQIRAKYDRLYSSAPRERDTRVPHFGTINNLVVFIKFSNSPDFNQNLTYYDNMFNNNTADYNSMRNYFQAVSYNQLDVITHYFPIPNNTTIVCYVDSQPRGYYMPWSPNNTIGYEEDDDYDRTNREFTLLTNASNYVSTQVPTTLDLDGDDDGDIDNVCFVVQGSTTAWATLLWPHRWSIYNSQAYINGSRVYDFNFQLESFMNSSGTSVLCHEMTHTLGAPDLYRYYDDTIDPIGSWDLMCGNTNPPQSMSAWMKHKYMDWVPTVPTLTQSGTYTINSVWSNTNNIYRIPSWKSTEFYVIEYRKPFGIYDTQIPGSGLLIYRLNVNADGNASGPPDELYLYRPGGTSNTVNGAVSMANFSQQTGRILMNETTSPSGFLSDELPGGLDISRISASGDETMSFYVNISNVQVTYPKGGETFFSGSSKTITWKARNQIGYAKIEFSSNNGGSWQTIVASTQNDGSHVWANIPMIDSDQCLIKVTTLTNSAVDVCNETFSVMSSIAVPTPVYPQNMMVNAPTNPVFKWNSVPGADSYAIQVAMDSLFVGTIINVIDLSDTTYTYNNLMPFTTYYWQVASFASVGLSEYCPAQKFTTGNMSILPAIPALLFPANNSTNQPRNPQLRWNGSNYAYYYHYQISTDSYFNNIVEQNDSLQGVQVITQLLAPNTRYYWRVRAGNPAGYSNFTNIRNFTTGELITENDEEVAVFTSVLKQNKPNPFSLSTQIEFVVKEMNEPVKLTIYNLKGQTVKVLFDGKAKSETNLIEWNGKDAGNKHVANGIYYYRLESKSFSQTRKLLLMR
jgi:M6 family metalloprotease-like protein